jgi:hypothetical protein
MYWLQASATHMFAMLMLDAAKWKLQLLQPWLGWPHKHMTANLALSLKW